jgi:hypothetical protein
VAALPARESGVPVPRAWRGPRAQLALAGLIALAVAAIALHFDARPRRRALDALPDTLRVLAALVAAFGACGLGTVRLLLPAPLRRYELLWVLPAGGCVAALALTVLGFAGVPFPISLAVVLTAGVGLSAHAIRARGRPALEARLAWPAFVACAVLAVALVPMVSIQHYAAPVGNGSDAHVAAGAANFLEHAYPTSVDIHLPINRMPETWKSKYPIYYAFAAISTVAGLATWQALAPLACALLALAAVGLFLVAVEVFGATAALAVAAMALAGLDRIALYTALHPYFNQTWGFFALPFTLVLGWWVAQPGLGRQSRVATAGLLAIFAAVLVLAYPLAAPIPAVPLLAFAVAARRRRIRAGDPGLRARDLYRGRRSLVWLVPLAAALAIPAVGVAEKLRGAITVLAPGHSLASWAGDMRSFIPFSHFLSLPGGALGIGLAVAVGALALNGLRGRERALSWGLGGLLVLGLALALYLRQRAYGYYFHFKLLAFIGPLLVLIAALGAGRLRLAGPALLAALALLTVHADVEDIQQTGFQLPQATVQLASWARSLPPRASVRLDMLPGTQLWAAYFMDARPLCSQLPLLATDYPHVPVSRKADYIVAQLSYGRPRDAIGAPLRVNSGYALYRENPSVPGVANCHYRRLDRIYTGLGYSPS